jgi:hypothetical protein
MLQRTHLQVERVSKKCSLSLAKVIMKEVLQFPPRLSLSKEVITEFLYGI